MAEKPLKINQYKLADPSTCFSLPLFKSNLIPAMKPNNNNIIPYY